jgi:hypothetical protein
MKLKHGSTIFLKLVIVLIGLAVLAVCVFLIPAIAKELTEDDPATSVYLAIVGVVSAIPFFFALYQAIRLLTFIDKNEAFSDLSVNALKRIKYSAISMSVIYATGMPFLFQIADADDAPGLVLLGMVIVAAPLVIAVFAAVLQKLVENAIEIKSENDLTV